MIDSFSPLLYLKLTSGYLRGLDVKSGKVLEEPTVLAVRAQAGKRIPVAMGQAAKQLEGQPGIELLNGLDHPRTLLANFSVAEQTLKLFVRQLAPKTFYSAAPVLVMHPQERLEGGLTQLETRGLYELSRCAGARKVYVWVGRELTREELRAKQFPAEGGSLLTP
ncbi:rod shape-determining protein [Pseudomonas tohonis]|uniref:rod shape-determining protein n=1 Tax=Pseudomonas tohonis TaxID=2725477 RepID=UPI0022F033F5|nr:rod shape-determining protein [Pseudomonas tohonis]